MLVPVGECKVLLVLRVKKHHKGTSPFIIDQIWDKPFLISAWNSERDIPLCYGAVAYTPPPNSIQFYLQSTKSQHVPKGPQWILPPGSPQMSGAQTRIAKKPIWKLLTYFLVFLHTHTHTAPAKWTCTQPIELLFCLAFLSLFCKTLTKSLIV